MEPDVQETQNSAGQNNKNQARSPAGPVLIIALFILSAGISYNLLAHCSFGFPRFISDQPLVDYCGAYDTNIDIQLGLADELANNVLSEPEAEPEITENPSSTEIEERLDSLDATLGSLSVTLAWSSRDDLDLHILCPGGKMIYFSKKKDCGAELEVDKNTESNMSDTPVEHITWEEQTEAPPGMYEIYVSRFEKRSALSSTPFVVELRSGQDVIQKFTGTARKKIERSSQSDATYLASFKLPLGEQALP